jgi:biotin--protein ligase
VLSTIHSLREALVPAVHVASLDAAALLAGGWQQQALLLVMPGGADLPYCKHLNGRGNVLIRSETQCCCLSPT